jgi:hypothetical protein
MQDDAFKKETISMPTSFVVSIGSRPSLHLAKPNEFGGHNNVIAR